jgi:peptidoglycan/xylan/chitin deacetylase (PgdA/CDA1 family)
VPIRSRIASALHQLGALKAVMNLRSSVHAPFLSVYTFHHIADVDDATYRFDTNVADATPAQFRRWMENVASMATPVSIDQLCGALDGKSLPKNPVVITFDDGYLSNYTTALPILNSLGIPAVFFVATDYIEERKLFWWEALAWMVRHTQKSVISIPAVDGGYSITLEVKSPSSLRTLQTYVKNTANIDVAAFLQRVATATGIEWTPAVEKQLADELIMNWDQVRALAAAGMDVESHSRSHRVLQTVPDHELVEELAGSKAKLEAELGQPVRAIAYPVGRRIVGDPRLLGAVQTAGYQLGFTNASGVNITAGKYALPRGHNRFDVKRLATDRDMSDAMLLAQMVVPPLAYVAET